MASLLRQIVAGPRARHPEAGLDLCYVTDSIVATSGPSGTYPQVAYRNPLKDLVKFLDSKHGEEWAIWEFRAEGTGYPDSEVYGRVRHYPWPDHHPPPFGLMPLIMGSMRNWLKGKDAGGKDRVVVVHCKAGKGRSGTVTCSYLISEEGWTPEDAMKRFTERRMKPGFGAGISIPSQIRWIGYIDRWTRHGKKYVERPAEVLEVHVWGLRDGVKIAVEGFVEEGKVIKTFHTFSSSEREVVRGAIRTETGLADVAMDMIGRKKADDKANANSPAAFDDDKAADVSRSSTISGDGTIISGGDVVFRPSSRIVLPSSDINIDFERRNKAKYGGFTMVTSVAHVWFNIFFEGQGPENNGLADQSGVFEIDWDAIDGIKGSSRKGTRAFDKMAVVWKAVDLRPGPPIVVNEPEEGQEVPQTAPADWRGANTTAPESPKLGLRPENPEDNSVSRASSVLSSPTSSQDHVPDEIECVRPHGPQTAHDLEGATPVRTSTDPSGLSGAASASAVLSKDRAQTDGAVDGSLAHDAEVAGTVSGMQHLSTADLPGGRPESDMNEPNGHTLGHMKLSKNADDSS